MAVLELHVLWLTDLDRGPKVPSFTPISSWRTGGRWRKLYDRDFSASKTLIGKGVVSRDVADEETEIKSGGYMGDMDRSE